MSLHNSVLEILLNSKTPVSGEDIAEDLHVSRTAIWKAVRVLKMKGFVITAKPRVGYVIENLPDRILPELVCRDLNTAIVGREIIHFDVTDSTNVQAKGLAEEGRDEGLVVIAEGQTRGKGRLKRSWFSPQYKNLLFSVIFRPNLLPLQVFRLNILASVSLVEAIERFTGLKPLIKWPNDIYIGTKKLAGILTEFSGTADGVEYAVLGVGLNVNFIPADQEEIVDVATSIQAETGQKVDRPALFRNILRRFDKHYLNLKQEKDAYLRQYWNNHSMVIGKPVKISSFDTVEFGTALSVDEDGSLIIVDEQGNEKRIICGDVSLRLSD